MPNRQESGLEFLVDGEDFAGRGGERTEVARIVADMLLRDHDINPETEAYTGELGFNINQVLDTFDETESGCVEETIRLIIATQAGGNPAQLRVELVDEVLVVKIHCQQIS